MATCSKKCEPTTSKEEFSLGVVTRARARRLSNQESNVNSPKKSPKKLLKNSKIPEKKSPKYNSVKKTTENITTMNSNNKTKSKKNAFNKSPIVEETLGESKANQSSEYEEECIGVDDKLNIPHINSPNTSNCKTKLEVPDISVTEDNNLAYKCLISEVKEEIAMSGSDTCRLELNNSKCKLKDEDILVEQCLENVQAPSNTEKNSVEEKLNKNDYVEPTAMDNQSKILSISLLNEKESSLVKKPTTPKKAVVEDKSESDDDSDAESRKEIMRSAEKRIIRNISTSESESRNAGLKQVKISTIVHDSTDSESDSAPEDVTFDASRKSALDIRKNVEESIKREKLRRKDKRKERLEMIRQRKEDNLIRLKERKANLEDASCSSSEESVHDINGQLSTEQYKVMGKKTYIVDNAVDKKQITIKASSAGEGIKRLPQELLENLPDQLPKKKKKTYHLQTTNKVALAHDKMENTKLRGSKTKRDVDFIPLSSSGSTQFGVVPLSKPQLKTVAQQAADFRNNMLYGSRINRVPASTLIKNRQKIEIYK